MPAFLCVAKKVSMSPFWNGFAMTYSNADANVGQLGQVSLSTD